MTPWTPELDMDRVSVSKEDSDAGSPKPGDMVARNPKKHSDLWLVAKKYFEDNLELVTKEQVPSEGLTFGQALEHLKIGHKVARAGWNGKGMYIYLQTDADQDSHQHFDPYLVMYTAGGTFQPGWLASQADMLASDWELV